MPAFGANGYSNTIDEALSLLRALQEDMSCVRGALEGVDADIQRDEAISKMGALPYAAAGVTIDLGCPSPGQAWVVQRHTVTIPQPATGTMEVAFYLDSQEGVNLVEVIAPGDFTPAGRYADGFDNDLYVPQNRHLLVVFSGAAGGVGQTVTVAIRGKQLVMDPQTQAVSPGY